MGKEQGEGWGGNEGEVWRGNKARGEGRRRMGKKVGVRRRMAGRAGWRSRAVGEEGAGLRGWSHMRCYTSIAHEHNSMYSRVRATRMYLVHRICRTLKALPEAGTTA